MIFGDMLQRVRLLLAVATKRLYLQFTLPGHVDQLFFVYLHCTTEVSVTHSFS